MNSYLRAIGFSAYTRFKQWDDLLNETIENPSSMSSLFINDGDIEVEITKHFSEIAAVRWYGSIYGELEDEDDAEYELIYPYYENENYKLYDDVMLERSAMINEYLGVCEDLRLGVSLIFSVSNILDIKEKKVNGHSLRGLAKISFTAYSISGTILLPIERSLNKLLYNKKKNKNRLSLMEAARRGDEEAMETLTMDDMDTYTNISKRIVKEDVFSIVDSSFMPNGLESDHYTIIGDIISVTSNINDKTGETFYNMMINCNEFKFDLIINEVDLVGMPEAGRRFKGSIWLQGKVIFA